MNEKAHRLLESSIDLFAKEGFWNTPTSKIAKHAGVATGTLFNYFPTKDALIDAVYMQLKEEWMGHIMADYPVNQQLHEQFEHVWFRAIDWGIENSIRYRLGQQLRLSNMVSMEAMNAYHNEHQQISELLELGIKDGVFVEGLTADYITQSALSQINTTVEYILVNELKDMALAKLLSRSFEMFWRGTTS